jgi:hypothetical protein
MADYGLFVGWGQIPRGRERKALDVFNEITRYYAGLQENGEIESFEPVLLEPHGGDLSGFILVRGEREKLARLRVDSDFQRRTVRAELVVDGFGVVGAAIGGAIGESMVRYQQQVDELA